VQAGKEKSFRIMGMNVRFIPKKDALERLEKGYPGFRPSYLEAIQSLFYLSADLEKAIHDHFERRCSFSRARFLILMVLLHSEYKRLPPNEIAKNLNVTRGNMTGLIEGLIKDGFVVRSNSSDDKRVVLIEVTEKGKAFLQSILPDYFKRMSQFMSVLDQDEIASFISIARKLQAGLTAFTEN
jgi:DNA-binding MarR family transcriptional regulator